MVIVTGILCLVFLCTSILILSSFPISLHEKRDVVKKKPNHKDDYSYLFEVYK
ncbi:hypothetical protein KUV80_15950 [Fictibacillus nanhaiensis]|uniref:hypothetical protein n=1 Tax=Fictibacillus nanhaiensis TaxID=742169 RepID=UPI001C968EC1|nr:hypothetical protein [Fictibacillus nanhaiensis]MBY6038153.1 hypothetical protein [Fictibacillus nanhaiensis]